MVYGSLLVSFCHHFRYSFASDFDRFWSKKRSPKLTPRTYCWHHLCRSAAGGFPFSSPPGSVGCEGPEPIPSRGGGGSADKLDYHDFRIVFRATSPAFLWIIFSEFKSHCMFFCILLLNMFVGKAILSYPKWKTLGFLIPFWHSFGILVNFP